MLGNIWKFVKLGTFRKTFFCAKKNHKRSWLNEWAPCLYSNNDFCFFAFFLFLRVSFLSYFQFYLCCFIASSMWVVGAWDIFRSLLFCCDTSFFLSSVVDDIVVRESSCKGTNHRNVTQDQYFEWQQRFLHKIKDEDTLNI